MKEMVLMSEDLMLYQKELGDKTRLSQTAIINNIKKFKELNLIERIGELNTRI